VTEGEGAGRRAITAVVVIAAVAIALFAATRARKGARRIAAAPGVVDVEADLATLPALPSPLGDRAFWIGGWVGPAAGDCDPVTWRTHAAAGLDVSMGPLEDRFRRADNVARLALLDSLRDADVRGHEASGVPFVFVRDDSLHPDETTRPGWEMRVRAVVRACGGSRSLAGYFLADEPRPADLASWAPAARLLRRLDPAHPAYVNFLPIPARDAADATARARWRADVTRAVTAGELALFTFDAYPFGAGDEQPHFLATLREAARVSHATARPFGVVLQWTGHAALRAVTAEEALYEATQALAHGASGITWFTYRTPNPDEEPWRWHGGAIAYDGTRTARFDTLAAINRRVRALAGARGARPMRAVHFGGGLPAGCVDLEDMRAMAAMVEISGVASVTGGPGTIGFTAPAVDGEVRYVLANRDRTRARTFTVTFAPPAPPRDFTLAPGDAVVFTARTAPPAPDPRTPSRSDRR